MVIYPAINLLRNEFLKVPTVKTITTDTEDVIDVFSSTIFPLVNLNATNAQPMESVNRITVTVTVLQQRDDEAKLNNKRFFKDNMIDNLDETYAISSKVINRLRSFYNEGGVDIFSVSDILFLKSFGGKDLDGCTFTVVLEVDNPLGC